MCEKPNWICHAVISVWHRGVTVRSLPALSREGKRSRPQPTWKRFQNAFVKVSALSSSCLRWAAVWCSCFSGISPCARRGAPRCRA